jgi:type I restriction enzyme S subunit
MHTDYKETPIGKIPEDWEVVRLGDILIECHRYPTYYGIEYVNQGVPEIRGELLLDNGRIETNFKKIRHITQETAGRFPKVRVIEGDLVFSVRGTMGKVGFVPKELEGAVVTANLMRLSPNRQKAHSEWLIYYLTSHKFQHVLNVLSSYTTIKTIQAPVLKSISILLPPPPEQRRIAEILTTADTAIQKVDDAIAKTERLKSGLMQELLTKGIGHEEFKDSEVGRIPRGWEVKRIGEVTHINVGHVGPISKYYTTKKEGMPLLSTTNISANGIKLNNIKYVTHDFYNKNKKSQVFSGDVIIARHGKSGTATTIPENFERGCCLNVVVVRKSEKFVSNFIESLFNSEHTRTRLVGWKSGSVQGVVNTTVLQKLKIPIPPLSEQHRIAEILSTVNKKLELERKRKEKLERIKKGLMNDLLTGRKQVRVNG